MKEGKNHLRFEKRKIYQISIILADGMLHEENEMHFLYRLLHNDIQFLCRFTKQIITEILDFT